LNFNMWYDTNITAGGKTSKIVGDINLSTDPLTGNCDSNVNQTGMVCSWDWNIMGVGDHNYWITIEINDGNLSVSQQWNLTILDIILDADDDGYFAAVDLALEEGNNQIKVQAEDPRGHISFNVYGILVDMTKPEIKVDDIPDILSEKSVNVKGTVVMKTCEGVIQNGD